MSIIIRAAAAADQRTITSLVRGAGLNPMRLAWPNFLVAERVWMDGSQLVAVGQLRPHKDGTVELASLVVIPEEQGRGIGGLLVETLIRKANGKLYLMCNAPKVPFYQQFGFYELLTRAEMPRSLRRMHRMIRLVEGLLAFWAKEPLHVAIMAHSGVNSLKQ
jgi:amino-acid N-acetyltransferase